jgi:uncharacterized protein YicC (UPF0701 family)
MEQKQTVENCFITQEMGREINTMGSNPINAQMQKLVVMMKDELEKSRTSAKCFIGFKLKRY